MANLISTKTYVESLRSGSDPNLISTKTYIEVLRVDVSQCATPILSPTSTAVIAGTGITITCDTPGVTIFYTTDGSAPTETSSVYFTPIIINTETTIKTYAIKEGYTDSSVASETYTIAEVSATQPLVFIVM